MSRDEIIDEIYGLSSFAIGNGDVCEIIARRLRRLAEKIEEPQAAPEISMQMLIDAGLNGFAFELVSESLAGKKDIKTFNRLHFSFRGVTYTLEPTVKAEEVEK